MMLTEPFPQEVADAFRVRDPLDPEIEAIGTAILDEAFAIHRTLGPVLKEEHYKTFLSHALRRRGIDVEREVWLDIDYAGLRLERALRLDLLVGGRVVVEAKADRLPIEMHEAQVVSYLRHSGHRLGFLLNFRETFLRNGIRRYVGPIIRP